MNILLPGKPSSTSERRDGEPAGPVLMGFPDGTRTAAAIPEGRMAGTRKWRTPLREAFDYLAERIDTAFDNEIATG